MKTKKMYVVLYCAYEQGMDCSNWTPTVGVCKKVFATLKEAKEFVTEELEKVIAVWKESGLKPKITKWVRKENDDKDEGVKWKKTLWDANFDADDEDWEWENTSETFYQISEIELPK